MDLACNSNLASITLSLKLNRNHLHRHEKRAHITKILSQTTSQIQEIEIRVVSFRQENIAIILDWDVIERILERLNYSDLKKFVMSCNWGGRSFYQPEGWMQTRGFKCELFSRL